MVVVDVDARPAIVARAASIACPATLLLLLACWVNAASPTVGGDLRLQACDRLLGTLLSMLLIFVALLPSSIETWTGPLILLSPSASKPALRLAPTLREKKNGFVIPFVSEFYHDKLSTQMWYQITQ